jgi:hypothetical protein
MISFTVNLTDEQFEKLRDLEWMWDTRDSNLSLQQLIDIAIEEAHRAWHDMVERSER